MRNVSGKVEKIYRNTKLTYKDKDKKYMDENILSGGIVGEETVIFFF